MDVLLDLLNSRPMVNGEERDELGDPANGKRWAREHGGDGSTAELELLREARDALRNVVRGESPPDVLSPLLDGVRQIPEITSDGLQWTVETPCTRGWPSRCSSPGPPARRTSPADSALAPTPSASCSCSTAAAPTARAGARWLCAATAQKRADTTSAPAEPVPDANRHADRHADRHANRLDRVGTPAAGRAARVRGGPSHGSQYSALVRTRTRTSLRCVRWVLARSVGRGRRP